MLQLCSAADAPWLWDLLDLGLAAASVSTPTVTQYTQCFKHLRADKGTKESGACGKEPRHDVMVLLDNFPEKSGSMEASAVRKSLKRRNLLSAFFPKKCLLGRVCCSSGSFTGVSFP